MMAELAPQSKTGSYERPSYKSNGKIGSGVDDFPDEKGRYHLYLGNPCPWCHRVKLAVAVKGFGEENIGQTRLVDDPVKASRGGWIFSKSDQDPLGSYDLVSSIVFYLIYCTARNLHGHSFLFVFVPYIFLYFT